MDATKLQNATDVLSFCLKKQQEKHSAYPNARRQVSHFFHLVNPRDVNRSATWDCKNIMGTCSLHFVDSISHRDVTLLNLRNLAQDKERSNLELGNFNTDEEEDAESETLKVEVGDNFAVISDELKKGDPSYMILCDKALHQCQETFEDEWRNQWYEGDMILCGFSYHQVLGQRGLNTSYRLLNDSPLAYAYSHLALKANFPMLPSATRIRNPQFLMSPYVRESLITIIEERQNYGQILFFHTYYAKCSIHVQNFKVILHYRFQRNFDVSFL